ncbi:hypothetical protein OS493_014965 [Desmophyllum pertusum]|uniref:DUF5641 domain-containing protein n=1 Tax=Desmophyllum pertusum TaxID=174260 RepID=A0A9X0A268_9CNID|nr:hypothetical protein OS493_014965 [Desmophyllum pertusum]
MILMLYDHYLDGTSTVLSKWSMAKVLDAHQDDQGQVRSVTIQSSSGSVLKRPINKLVLLVESSEGRPGSPDEEPEEPEEPGEPRDDTAEG